MESENKLGVMPVGRLLANMSLPIVISMLVQALYNVVDSIFVARLSMEAITAVSLCFPAQNLMIAVAVGTGVGVNSLLARRLGARQYAEANKTALNGILLAVLSWAAFALAGLLFSGAFFASYAKQPNISADVLEMGESYMCIVTVFSMGVFGEIMFERLLQATGRSFLSMVSQMTGAVLNIILDPILIFGLLGAPKLGVAGAAIATVIGQLCSMMAAIAFNFIYNKEIHLNLHKFRPCWNTIKNIYKVGLPGILMQSIGSVMVFLLNTILGTFGEIAVSVFGIYFKLQSFIFMPVFGFNSGMIPIIAFNYGAKKPDRIEKTIKMALVINTCIMAAGMLLFWVAPEFLLRLFDASDDMLEIGTTALRVISLSYVFAAVTITFVGVFQAFGKGVYALIMSIVRQLVFLLPIAWVFSQIAGLDAVWHAFYIAEFVAVVLSVVFYMRVRKSILKPLYAEQTGHAELQQKKA